VKPDIPVEHEFVEFIPKSLREKRIYISIEYRVVAHLCPCGCGEKIVTPLSPAQWTLLFDGETVSLYPSVGSWDLPCRSHYWIKNDRIRWAKTWSDDKIRRGRESDKNAVRRHFGADSDLGSLPADTNEEILRKWFDDK